MAAMAEERVQRRLAAILAVDVVGYSRLMGVDEAGNNRSNRETTDDTNMCSVVRSDPAFGLPILASAMTPTQNFCGRKRY